MRGGEEPVFPFGLSGWEFGPEAFVGIVAEEGDGLIGFVDDGDAGFEFGDGDVVTVDGGGAGAAEVLGDDGDEVAIEVHVDETAVFAVADEEERFGAAGVEGDAVAGFEFAVGVAFAAEGFDVFAGGVVFVDEGFAVAVGDEDGSVWADGDAGWGVAVAVRVGVGFLGVAEFEDGFAVEVEFDDVFGAEVCGVDEFLAVFFADHEPVDAGELWGDFFDESAIGFEDEETFIAIGADVDVAGFVDDDAAVGGADVDGAGDGSPARDGLVGEGTGAGDDWEGGFGERAAERFGGVLEEAAVVGDDWLEGAAEESDAECGMHGGK